jgi:predicted nuclease of predicted toxin-antitoxin system
LNFLIDAQLPPALARWISEKGHGATHVFDLGLHASADSVVWDEARRTNAVIISKDEDFVDRWLMKPEGVPLIWVRRGNCSNQALFAWLQPLWPDIVGRLEKGEQFIEIRP